MIARYWPIETATALPTEGICSNDGAIVLPLIALVAVVTAVCLAGTWFFSGFLQGMWKPFIRFLPVVMLWVPVPVAPGVLLPAGIALLYFAGDHRGALPILVAEAIGVAAYFGLCCFWQRRSPDHQP